MNYFTLFFIKLTCGKKASGGMKTKETITFTAISMSKNFLAEINMSLKILLKTFC